MEVGDIIETDYSITEIVGITPHKYIVATTFKKTGKKTRGYHWKHQLERMLKPKEVE